MLGPLTEITGFFVGDGKTLWLLQDAAGHVSETRNNSSPFTDLQLVVLVDGKTESGELIAVAIQRNQRGMVVGQHTVGNSAQRKFAQNPDGSSRLEVTGSFLANPGEPITGVGVTPDKLLPDLASDEDFLKTAGDLLIGNNEGKPSAAEPATK